MRTNTTGLSILAGGLAFVGSVGATDLIVNGSFEDGPGVGWVGDFGTYNFSAAYFAGPPIPESEAPGSLYSWRHGLGSDNFSGPLTQTVVLSPAVSEADVDAGRGQMMFSAWLASYTQNPDRPYVTVQFLDASQSPVGGLVALDRTSGVGFVRFADGVTTFDSTTHEHYWAKYVRTGPIPPGARSAIVGVTHSPNASFSGRPDSYTDLVKLDVSAAAFVPPSVASALPSGPNIRPDVVVAIVLQDGTTQVDTNTLALTFDGVPVTPAVSKVGVTTTIEYDPPGLLPASSAHVVRLIARDNGTPTVTSLTNQFSFQVLSYYDLLLPAPLYLETFDGTAEGSLPDGWNGVSFSAVPDANVDLNDLNSAAYAGWTVVSSGRFNDPLLTYNTHEPTTDYRRVLSSNPANVVNGEILPNLAQDKICFGNSGYRDGGYQVLYLTSRDFDLSGQTNVYLVFHSLWEQNQDSIGAVEYSIDEGASWLPIVYLIDRADIVLDGDGKVDPIGTFGTPRDDTAVYTDPGDNQPRGGYYGAFIGVESNRWSELGPYISGRVDDNPVESKRVEVFRLGSADHQGKVRLRFAHAGADSWYFGIDNVGFYSFTTLNPPQIAGPTPATLTEAEGNHASFSVTPFGVGPFTYRWRRDGMDLPGQDTSALALTNLRLADAGSYDVVVGYVGGSVTSAAVALTVFMPPPALVIGQWDFNALDLSATCGRDLEFADLGVDLATGFSDTDSFLIPRLDGQAVNAMSFPGGGANGGYRMHHGLSGTGGGNNVNQYTLIFDILYPAAANNVRRTLLQTDPSNTTDGDLRVDENNRIGVDGVYHGRIEPDTWYRIALAVDLAGPGPNPIVAKFINGTKVGQQVLPEGRDGRWSLPAGSEAPYARLFADNDVDVQQGYVSSIQLRSGRLSDAAISAMGGPGAGKIPGAACAVLADGRPVIRWSGNSLEVADEVSGPWTVVPGAARPYPVPTPLAARKFYRSQ